MIEVNSYTIPTIAPESDGTAEWDSTTLVTVRIGDGFGYTYADEATALFISKHFADMRFDPMSPESVWSEMIAKVRNLGRRGVAAMAISAVDAALWDWKCKLLNVPLCKLLGVVREAIPVYNSGGFTSMSIDELQQAFAGWKRVKMKVGRDWRADRERVSAVRDAIGPDAELFVDANGAYTRKLALWQAEVFAEDGVTWLEEPVSSDDLEGLRFIRERTPIEVAAGEYGYELQYFDEMIASGAVDVLQADATRCTGITGFIKASALCESRSIPLSSHCAPSLHAHLGCALLPMRHLEYFFDHVRIERELFDGFREAVDGEIRPDLSRPGLGIEFRQQDAQRLAAVSS